MSLTEIMKTIEREKLHLKTEFHVKKVGIFGSYAHGTSTKKSDVDILVEFSQPIGLGFIRLQNYLEKKLKKKVDLATTKALKPLIRKQILADTRFI